MGGDLAVNFDSLLETHAEVAVALAGFASVAAVLQRPLSARQRRNFLSLLYTSLVQVLGSLVPVWLPAVGIGGPTLWRVSTAMVLALSTAAVLVMSMRVIFINRPLTYLCNVLTLGIFIALVFNTFGLGVAPGFGLYYTALLLGMVVIFIMFADAVVGEATERD